MWIPQITKHNRDISPFLDLKQNPPEQDLNYNVIVGFGARAQNVNVSPFQCPGGTFTPNMKSTKDYPDEVINFMRNHPAMHNAVYPVHKRPLVVRTNVDYEFTTISVDQVTAADGNYEVLFLGTGECFIKCLIWVKNRALFVFITLKWSHFV